MQHEIKSEKNIFNENGNVIVAGWSKSPIFKYDKDFCKASRLKLNEKDSYYIESQEMGLYLSVAEYGINTYITATLVEFESGIISTSCVTKLFTAGRSNLPLSSCNGDVTYADNRVGINFSNTSIKRFIKCDFINFADGKNLYVNLALCEKYDDSLNVMIPFAKNKKSFFLKRFLPCLSVTGVIRCGGAEYNLNENNSTAYLDWSRYAVSGRAFYHALYSNWNLNGKPFAICLAGGVGNATHGNENSFFYDGVMHKLASLKATGSEEHLDKPWKFQAGTSVMDINFKPLIKNGKLMSVDSDKRSMIFGTISGVISQIDLEPIKIDSLPAHMEFTMF